MPVRRVPGDATAAGVAMLAGIGAGATPGRRGRRRRVPPGGTGLPDPANREVYERARRYLAVRSSGLVRAPQP